ncbi:MAG TPA: cell wall hydrolase [Allosphingosinicella sp.]
MSALLASSASCVPAGTAAHPESFARIGGTLELAALRPAPAMVAAEPLQRVEEGLVARPFRMQGASLSDQLRALDCLADAVYYEARSEGEDGQRAVAQVVLNRVRHPAYPASVCAVVYQGPQRAGGGCQFTFTCDGSLARGRYGPAWREARRIAAEALVGRVYAPVGTATHYHTFAVSPPWAERLVKAAVIGAHIFYRWDGIAGSPAAFAQAYSGHEPGRPGFATAPLAFAAATHPPVAQAEPILAYAQLADVGPAAPPPDALPQSASTAHGLPSSRIRAEYLNSGAWRGTPR